MKYAILMRGFCLSFFLMASLLSADVPQMINYQGRLTDEMGEPVDGQQLIKFKIYRSAEHDDSLWWSGFQPVQVDNGLFDYQLGSAVPLPDDLFATGGERWLGITVGVDPEITPRTRITSMAYACQALRSDSSGYAMDIADNLVTSAKIADDEIVDKDISGAADIATNKISGTAVNLSSTQTIVGDKTFDGSVYFGDSTMRIDNNGIRFGDNDAPSEANFIRAERTYNTESNRKCCYINIKNSSYSGGDLHGIYNLVENYGFSPDGNATGIYASAMSDGARFGGYFAAHYRTSYSSGTSWGVRGSAYGGIAAYGVYGHAEMSTDAYAVYGDAGGATDESWAGYFNGDVRVTGTFDNSKGGIIIDHPLDPENMYLCHSTMNSPEMKNVYDGTVTTGGDGLAVVYLPDYFETFNRDFRYQLTCIGSFAQAIIKDKISNNRFTIATSEPDIEVSWQVTGIRKDAFAETNPARVEVEKPVDEKGLYLNPAAYGYGEDKFIHYQMQQSVLKNRPEEEVEDEKIRR